MSEPAWTLRAVAVNPSCPQDLSDELLTWLALGGAGHVDPLFDPLECTGHPDDTRTAAAVWYLRRAALEYGDEHGEHPLWRVRASVMEARRSIPGARARTLARDPRPEVRRMMAGLATLPVSIRLELRHDADATVARLARGAFQGKNAGVARQRLAGAVRQSRLLLPVAVSLAGIVIWTMTQSVLWPASTPTPAIVPGPTVQQEPMAARAGRPLTGGGSLMCGSSSAPARAYVSVAAGTEKVTVRLGSPAMSPAGLPVSQTSQVLPGHRAEYLLVTWPAHVTVTVASTYGPPSTFTVTWPRCGR
jgi:hypothetical protein